MEGRNVEVRVLGGKRRGKKEEMRKRRERTVNERRGNKESKEVREERRSKKTGVRNQEGKMESKDK